MNKVWTAEDLKTLRTELMFKRDIRDVAASLDRPVSQVEEIARDLGWIEAPPLTRSRRGWKSQAVIRRVFLQQLVMSSPCQFTSVYLNPIAPSCPTEAISQEFGDGVIKIGTESLTAIFSSQISLLTNGLCGRAWQ